MYKIDLVEYTNDSVGKQTLAKATGSNVRQKKKKINLSHQ